MDNAKIVTSEQLIQRLCQFDGAEKEAALFGDDDFRTECADIVSAIRELLVLRGKSSALQEWISVDEHMPEEGDAVLVHQEGGIIFCAEAEHGWFYPDEFPNLSKQGREITHWMPFPAAPTAQEKK